MFESQLPYSSLALHSLRPPRRKWLLIVLEVLKFSQKAFRFLKLYFVFIILGLFGVFLFLSLFVFVFVFILFLVFFFWFLFLSFFSTSALSLFFI